MSDIDRMLGKFEEFREWERAEHSQIKSDLTEIKKRLDELHSFKIKIIAIASTISIIASKILDIF